MRITKANRLLRQSRGTAHKRLDSVNTAFQGVLIIRPFLNVYDTGWQNHKLIQTVRSLSLTQKIPLPLTRTECKRFINRANLERINLKEIYNRRLG